MPFTALAVTDSPALLQRCNEIWVADDCPASDELPPLSRYAKHDKIRLGYFSADLQEHATAYLMAELFERHDRDRFELYAFSFGPQSSDAMRQRLMRAFDHFIDVRERSDVDIARLARELEIDIALDLKGFTADCRTRIFAYRAAPVQINYLGYPNTMGASYIDYLIADDTLIPEQHRNSYSEKIIYLPDSYQVNDTKRVISDRKYSRAELGLPETGFVFCSFNNTFKITPAIFSCWMRLLHAVPGSVMWLLEDNPDARANLEMEASRRQMDPRRLVFARRAPLAEHLARHRVADLFLDTLPCNAHTTTSDALWAGLPVLTCMGESFASRVAASLLRAAMLPELVTTSLEDYEALALRLATQPETLHAVREKLVANRLTCPLFDVGRYTSHLENAYLQIHQRHHAGLAPDHLHIRP